MFKNLRKEYYNNKSSQFGAIGIILLVVFAGFVFGIIGGMVAVNFNNDFLGWMKTSLTQGVVKEKVITSFVEEENLTIKAVNKVRAATVNIVISKDVSQLYNQTGPFTLFYGGVPYQASEPSGPQIQEVGGGSGFIISPDGLIVTNKHVIADTSAQYTAVLSDGRKFSAKIVASDPFIDVAFLKITAQNLPIVTLGDSDKISVGQTVIAIGYSLGEYQNTVTKGIVSGIKRRITAEGETLDETIQTDAAINPGNSGGPLVNLKAEVIGINTAINQQGQSVGFAIPINSVKQTIASVKQYGKIVRPWLGVRYVLLNDQIQKEGNLPVNYGAILVKGQSPTEMAVIPGSPADKAGLKENDIVLSVNGEKIAEDNSLSKLMGKYQVGTVINMKVLRQGKETMISVTLEEYTQK